MPEIVERGSGSAAGVSPDSPARGQFGGDSETLHPGPQDAGRPSADEIVAALQALLFISEDGLTEARLAAALDSTIEATRTGLATLQARLDHPASGIVLREHASGWRLTTAPACVSVLERFVIDGHSSRLSPAALETLAVVAYQQPVSRGRIAAIRGVAVDGVMRTLVARGLIDEAGAESSGAILYVTTALFMDKLGVKSLTELPELAPLLPDIETLDGFDDRPTVSSPTEQQRVPIDGPADTDAGMSTQESASREGDGQ